MKRIFNLSLLSIIIFALWLATASSAEAVGLNGCLTNLYRYNDANGTDYLTFAPGDTARCMTQTDLDNRGSHPNPMTYPFYALIAPYPAGTEGSRHGCNVNLTDGGFCWVRDDANHLDDGDTPGDDHHCSANIHMYVCDGKQTSCLDFSCNPGDAGCNRSSVDWAINLGSAIMPEINPDAVGATDRANRNESSPGNCSAPDGNNRDHYLETKMIEQAARVGCGKTIELAIGGIEWFPECIFPNHPYPGHWDSYVCKGTKDSQIWNGGAFPDSLVWYTGDCNDATCESRTPPQDPALLAGQVYAGQTYTASITIKNTGWNTWTSDGLYNLGSEDPQDNTVWRTANRVGYDNAVAYPVSTGQSVIYAFDIVAPITPGTYDFNWRMVRDVAAPEGGWFGEKCTSSVTVVSSPGAPNITGLKLGQGENTTSPISNGVYKYSGKLNEDNVGWLNPITFELVASPGTNATTTQYYVAFYTDDKFSNNTTFLIENGANPPTTGDIITRINDPANGFLLAEYLGKQWIWSAWDPETLTCTPGWRNLTDNYSGANPFLVKSCSGTTYYHIIPMSQSLHWTVYFQNTVGSKKFNTGAYATTNFSTVWSTLRGDMSPTPRP